MKTGLLTAIFETLSFEEVIDYCASLGMECMEVACWPQGKGERRYAGTSHIDVAAMDEEMAERINRLCREKGVSISALCYYPNVLDPDTEKASAAIDHLKKVIRAAGMLGVDTVGTFIGRDPHKTVDETFEDVKRVWPEIISVAEQNNVRIAIENCPMLFTDDEWPGGKNIATSPENWRRLFEILPSDHLGLNFDPSHFVWQQMDYIKAVEEFKDKIFHVHFKDIKLLKDQLSQVGVMATPLKYMVPKIPGHGDVDWKAFVDVLKKIGYEGAAVVEIEDKEYEDSLESIKACIQEAYTYVLKQF